MDDAGFAVSILEDEAAFALLKGEWELLLAAGNGHFFHDFSWNWHSWKCVAAGRGERLRVVVGRDQGRAVLILPLVVKDRVGRLLNAGTFAYRDLILAAGHRSEWLEAAWRAIAALREIDVLHFQNVRAPANLEHLLRVVKAPAWHVQGYSPAIRLGGYDSWEAFAATRPKKLMADQRRQWRRIRAALPGLECRQVREQDEVGPLVRWMLRQKAAWAHHKDLPMALSGDRGEVLVRAAEDACGAGRLLLFRLGDAENIVAAGMGFVHENEFTFELFSYDPAWENFSPSRLLMETLITHCIDRGLKVFDFLPLPPEGGLYKLQWADGSVLWSSYAIPVSALGAALVRWRRLDISAVAGSKAAQWAYRKLPGTAREMLRSIFVNNLPDVPRMVRRPGEVRTPAPSTPETSAAQRSAYR